MLLIKVEKIIVCLHILHWATESEKYILLTLFYDQNYVNLSNLKFHPLCHTKSSFFWKSPINILDQYASCTYCLSTFINCVELFRVLFKKWNERIWISLSNHFKKLTWYLQNNVTYNKMSHLKLTTDTKLVCRILSPHHSHQFYCSTSQAVW